MNKPKTAVHGAHGSGACAWSQQQSGTSGEVKASDDKRENDGAVLFRIGVAAIALSILPYLAIPTLPLLEISNARRAAYAGAAVVIAELVFLLGVALAGRETWRTVRRTGFRRAPKELWRLLRMGRRPLAPEGGSDDR